MLGFAYSRITALPFLAATLLALTGCDDLTHAGPVECGALFTHVVAVHVDEQAKVVTGTDDAATKLGGWAVSVVARQALEQAGEKQAFVERCQTTLRKYEVRRCLEKKTSAELKACGGP